MTKKYLPSKAILMLILAALFNSGCADNSKEGNENGNTSYEQTQENVVATETTENGEAVVEVQEVNSYTEEMTNDTKEEITTDAQGAEIQDINEQVSEDEMVAPTEETMREDCAGFAKEDGISEDDLEAYMVSCVEDLKLDFKQAQEEQQSEAPSANY